MTKITSTDRKVFWKWVTVIGFTGFFTGWATISTVVARWNAIPSLQESIKESQVDRKALREQISKHETTQAVDMKEIQMTLKAIEKVQAGQADQLKTIDRKLDRVITPRSATPTTPADPDSYDNNSN